jgi:hypothetical protein
LQKLERRAAFLIERNDFTVQDDAFGRQLPQGVQQFQVIERFLVARGQACDFVR